MIESSFEDGIDQSTDITNCKYWRSVNSSMSMGGLPGITAKLVVGGYDIYLKTVWKKGRIVMIDITLSSGGNNIGERNSDSLEQTKFDMSRSWVEDSCRLASYLLQTGHSNIDNVLDSWVGVEGFPHGYCPQLGHLQKGPLHACALLIKKRFVAWKDYIDNLQVSSK